MSTLEKPNRPAPPIPAKKHLTEYIPVKKLLAELLRQCKAACTSAQPSEDALLESLGMMLSFDEPSETEYLPDDDLGTIILLDKDLPEMTAGDVCFKFGSTSMKQLIEKHLHLGKLETNVATQKPLESNETTVAEASDTTECATDTKESTSDTKESATDTKESAPDSTAANKADDATETASKVEEESEQQLFDIVDPHRFDLGILFEYTREYGNFWGETPFPFYIKDHKFIFESSGQANEYVKKAWRFLTENHIPRVSQSDASTTSRAGIYRKITHKEIHNAPSVGYHCKVMQTSRSVTTHITTALKPTDTVIYTFVTGNVVSKMFFCTRRGEVPVSKAGKIAELSAKRCMSWARAVQLNETMASLPAELATFRLQLLDYVSKQLRSVQLGLDEQVQALEPFFKLEECTVCRAVSAENKRCKGCRQFPYCGKDCQRKHWKAVHQSECSMEFAELTKS